MVRVHVISVERLILACFLLSGFASLVYEVVWTRMLVLIFGATTLAISTVLTAFMAGLALGSLLFSRILIQRVHPLLMYALLELGVGIYGLFIPLLLPFLAPLYQMSWDRLHQDFYLFSLVRFFLVGFVLLPPTILMGATLPVLSQFFSRQAYRAGRCLGFLYGMNTLGAVLGTFSTGFILLPGLGVLQSTGVTALINFLVAGLSLLTWKMSKTSDFPEEIRVVPRQVTSSPVASTLRLDRSSWVVLIAFFLSGLAAMVYEVAWSRALSLVLGSTIYAFSAMLTTFLLGLALGSFASSLWVERLRSPLRTIGILQIVIGVSAYCTMSMMGELPYLSVFLYRMLPTSEQWLPILWFVIAFLVMFPPTFFLGMLFPCVVRLFQSRIPMLGRLAGDVYAVNTFGAILGSSLAGFVFIPFFGIQNSVMAMIYLNLVLGIVLLSTYRGVLVGSWVLGVLILGVLLSVVKPSWNTRVMSSGVFMYLPYHAEDTRATGRTGFYSRLASEGEVIFYKEGITATVTVEKENFGTMALRVNGRKESGERFMRTQVLIGHIPLLFARDPKDILVIGWGSGTTVGSVTQYPVEQVKAVELERGIIEATPYFEQANQQPLKDPRVEVIVNDGRNYLLVTPEQFDVIIAQPSLPWITGASNLFTREFFELGASRLRKNGVFGQWITGDAIQYEDLKSVVMAFDSAFGETWIFQTHPGDILLLGFKDTPALDLVRMQEILAKPNISEDLKRVQIHDPYDLLSLYLMGGESIKLMTAGALSNTDDNGYIEFFGPRHFYASRPDQVRATTEVALMGFLVNEIRAGRLPFSRLPGTNLDGLYLQLADACLKNDRGPCALSYAEESLKQRETAQGHYIRGKVLVSLLDYMESTNPDRNAGISGGSFKGGLGQREQLLSEVVASFRRALQVDPAWVQAHLELGKLFEKRGDMNAAKEEYMAVLRQKPDFYEARVNLGTIYIQEGKLQQALNEYQKILPFYPQDSEIHFKLGVIYAKMAQYQQAMRAYETTLSLTPDHPEAHFNLAMIAERGGRREIARPHFRRFLELAPPDPTYAHYRQIAEEQLREFKGEGIQK